MLNPKRTSQIVPVVLFVGATISVAALVPRIGAFHLPGNNQGYAPEQPIAFSHRLHAGELLIDCLYCHHGAEKSRHAGIPSADVCMNCHQFVTATWGAVRAEDDLAQEEDRKPERIVSGELQKLYDALALDETLKRDPERESSPIEWIKVHTVPDFVFFDHRPHVSAGVACQRCHGPVETMERMRQAESLSMGWCVNCHRQVRQTGVGGQSVNPSIDCVACHY